MHTCKHNASICLTYQFGYIHGHASKQARNDPSCGAVTPVLPPVLTHGFELGDELVAGPLLALGPEGEAGGQQELVVVRVRHVQVVHQHNVRVLGRQARRHFSGDTTS